ncbi:MAG: IMP dehydrogenase [Candidatus Zixiibacteriota bacterium]|jgi:IMP dehydrogenase
MAKFDPKKTAVTFDDVLLKPRYSEVLPGDVDVRTRFTRQIKINIPIVSAAMDTVTEASLAIALAQAGGIGVVHRNMPAENQAAEVNKVKRYVSGMIVDPYTLPPTAPVADALAIMADYKISGVPVVDEEGTFLGIITNRDLRFEKRRDIPVAELMTADDLVTAPVGTSLEKAKQLLHQHRIEKLPIVDKAGRLRGLITVKDIVKALEYPDATKDGQGRLCAAAAVGVGPKAMERVKMLWENGCDVIVVDTAHGHSKGVVDTVKAVKRRNKKAQVVAGNVGTAEGAAALIEAGADGVKVGIGPSAICTTRVVAGAGVPQVSAVMDAATVCHKARVPLIADGGIKYSGDITKAIAAGADCVMIGSLFAGTEESPGELILYEGRTYKSYRGMGSMGAMGGSSLSRDRYGLPEEVEAAKLVPEGIEGRVPYRGPLSQVVYQLVGGLRAGMGYCGAGKIKALWSGAEFVRVTTAGLAESHPHDVHITKEAPNYGARSPYGKK